MQNQHSILRTREVAILLGINGSTLARIRARGDGPPYAKLGPRLVVYDLDAVNQWLRERTVGGDTPDNSPIDSSLVQSRLKAPL